MSSDQSTVEHTLDPDPARADGNDATQDPKAAFAAATAIATAKRDANSTTDKPLALQLRVLEGPQQGARAPWPKDKSLIISTDGAAPTEAGPADIVLLGEFDAPVCIRISANPDQTTGVVHVLQGQIQIQDKTIASGEQSNWMRFQSLAIGLARVAFGPADREQWSQPNETSTTTQSSDSTEQLADPTDIEPGQSATGSVFRWLVISGLIVVALGGTAFALMAPAASHSTAATTEPQQPELADQLRHTSEFAGLQVQRDADNQPVIQGRLANQQQLGRLTAWLVKHDYGDARVQVALDEDLIRDVSEVLRVNGVTARTQLQGAGEVTAQVEEADLAKLDKAIEAARRDVPGLTRLTVKNSAKPAPRPTPKLPDDPKKRIVSLVAGKRGYLVTADGSRYFIGAMLPNGHRVARIQGSTITLERDGEKTKLDL